MQYTLKGLVWRYRLLCLCWSLTSLCIGLQFVYISYRESIDNDFDLAMKTNSFGVAATGLLVSPLFSIYLSFYRRKVSALLQKQIGSHESFIL